MVILFFANQVPGKTVIYLSANYWRGGLLDYAVCFICSYYIFFI